MRLKDYLVDYADCRDLKGIVRGVAEWLQEQARGANKENAAERVTANAMTIAATELTDQIVECWP